MQIIKNEQKERNRNKNGKKKRRFLDIQNYNEIVLNLKYIK